MRRLLLVCLCFVVIGCDPDDDADSRIIPGALAKNSRPLFSWDITTSTTEEPIQDGLSLVPRSGNAGGINATQHKKRRRGRHDAAVLTEAQKENRRLRKLRKQETAERQRRLDAKLREENKQKKRKNRKKHRVKKNKNKTNATKNSVVDEEIDRSRLPIVLLLNSTGEVVNNSFNESKTTKKERKHHASEVLHNGNNDLNRLHQGQRHATHHHKPHRVWDVNNHSNELTILATKRTTGNYLDDNGDRSARNKTPEIELNVIPAITQEEAGANNEDDDNTVPILTDLSRPTGLPSSRRHRCKGVCDQLCHWVKGREVCSCFKGFRLHGNKCRDVNECLVDNGSCEKGCRNTLGSYHCYCPPGFRLKDNDKTCRDVNECLLRNGHGPCQDTCTNKWDGYTCSCDNLPGTHLSKNGHTCKDVDECSKNNAGCSHTCLNTLGNVFCLCPSGFQLGKDWKTCQDIDECLDTDLQNESCPERCVNTLGSYHCTKHIVCPSGFKVGADQCEDIDECKAEHDCSHLCINTNGSYHCACKLGYVLNEDKKSCKKVAHSAVCPPLDTPVQGYLECSRLSLRSGSWRYRVVNHSGSYCELRCPKGYRLVGAYRKFCGQNGRWLGLSYGTCVRHWTLEY